MEETTQHRPAPLAPRQQRRRERTRASLIVAARELVAQRGAELVTLADITDAADLGAGTFYNYFSSREEIIDAIADDSIETVGARLDLLTADMTDAAEVFAVSLRHLLKTATTDPVWARFVVRLGVANPKLLAILGPRASRDITRGIDSGQFSVPDVDIATACVFGALLSTLHHAVTADSRREIDQFFARTMLSMVGLSSAHAEEVACRPLPPLPELPAQI